MIAIEQDDPLDELTRENETTQRLLEQLLEKATRLRNGTEVPPGVVAEGLRLIEQYRKLHAKRVDEQLQPEARRVAMPSCFDHLDAVARAHQATREHVERVEGALEIYARGDRDGRPRLAEALEEFAQKEYEALQYEEEYPLSCLRAALPSEAAARVRQEFSKSSHELIHLEAHVDHHLASPGGPSGGTFPVHCQAAGCPARAQAESFPTEHGFLGLRAPVGWRAVPRPPHAQAPGIVAVEIVFRCPEHLPEDDASDTSRPSLSARAGTSHPRRGPGSEVPGCCDPDPGRAA